MLLKGNCLDTLRTLEDNSVDSVVTDPPYELGLLGKSWDSSGIAYNPELWSQVLRVLKPGGHLLAFGGSRTIHRIAVTIEDAGFEIRDSIHWTYGSGFPKSLDVSKAIDKQRYQREEIYEVTAWMAMARDYAGKTNADLDEPFDFSGMGGHWTSTKSQPAVPTLDQIPTILEVLGISLDDVPERIRELIWTLNGEKGKPGAAWFDRPITGTYDSPSAGALWRESTSEEGEEVNLAVGERRDIPATPEAAQWLGWGTALKPSHEPIVVARKPLEGTVAQNVLKWGVGGINIDGTRVPTNDPLPEAGGVKSQDGAAGAWGGLGVSSGRSAELGGRWPANTILTCGFDCDGANHGEGCPVADLDRQSGASKSASGISNFTRKEGGAWEHATGLFSAGSSNTFENYGDSGGASRYFTVTPYDEIDWPPVLYYTKPGAREKNAGLDSFEKRIAGGMQGRQDGSFGTVTTARNFHPTVKPISLMRHLIRLVTPKGGKVLDPFLGSGTTAVSAVLEGCEWVGCELTPDYWPLIEARVAEAHRKLRDEGIQESLF